jgi:hypothetical protein
MLSCLYYTGTQPLTDSGTLIEVSNGTDTGLKILNRLVLKVHAWTAWTFGMAGEDDSEQFMTQCVSLELFVLSDYFSCRTTPTDQIMKITQHQQVQ